MKMVLKIYSGSMQYKYITEGSYAAAICGNIEKNVQ